MALVGVAYVSTRCRIYAKADIWVLSQFAPNLALTALTFKAMASRHMAEVVNATKRLVAALGSLGGLILVCAEVRLGAWLTAPRSRFASWAPVVPTADLWAAQLGYFP